MSELINVNKEYAEWISDVRKRFKSSQAKAATHVNAELLKFYWGLGKDISEREESGKYGKYLIDNISKDLKNAIPGVNSFSRTNLYYTKCFYELYSNLSIVTKKFNEKEIVPQVVGQFKKEEITSGFNQKKVVKAIPPQFVGEFKGKQIVPQSTARIDKEKIFPQIAEKSQDKTILPQTGEISCDRGIVPQIGGQSDKNVIAPQTVAQLENKIFCIPWGHHRIIIDKCKGNQKKALFFVNKTLENNWSRAVLLNFLETDLYERNGKAITNFKEVLPELSGELAQEMTKDPYCFDFLTLREDYNEKELKEALLDNIQKFLLELGNGFTFAGKEYRLTIGKTEQYLDMLFYHVPNHCYVVIEVKISEFKPADMGQLGTYVTAVDDLLKGNNDNATVGLLICKTKDNILAKYAVKAANIPVGISEYQLSSLVPEEYKSSLPTIEEIERGLRNL